MHWSIENRFIPVIGIFAPFVAGMGCMTYPHYVFFNVTRRVVRTVLFLYAGYFSGGLEIFQHDLQLLIVLIIFIYIIPVIIEIWRNK